MDLNTKNFLAAKFPNLADALNNIKTNPDTSVSLTNQDRVLGAFANERVASHDLTGTTGYGYNDHGRDKLESLYAQIFGGEAALVRPQIASGTHALWLALAGNTEPGDEIISVTGRPYATLDTVISQSGPGTFKSANISFESIDLLSTGKFDLDELKARISSRTRIVYVQKSRGYSLRKPVGCGDIGELSKWLKENYPSINLMVDNCYGEFVEAMEPGQMGADLTVGSLIKNPGGGLADTGGYVVGKEELVENAANRLLAPGLDGQIGATGNYLRGMYQGLFLAPHFVGQAVSNARFAASLAESLGFESLPGPSEERYDLVQAINLGSAQRMERFCQMIQTTSPIDSYVAPTAGDVPGYRTPVIMAAGTFVQGASLELSADGPLAPPFTVFLQGGLGSEHGLLAICAAFSAVLE